MHPLHLSTPCYCLSAPRRGCAVVRVCVCLRVLCGVAGWACLVRGGGGVDYDVGPDYLWHTRSRRPTTHQLTPVQPRHPSLTSTQPPIVTLPPPSPAFLLSLLFSPPLPCARALSLLVLPRLSRLLSLRCGVGCRVRCRTTTVG